MDRGLATGSSGTTPTHFKLPVQDCEPHSNLKGLCYKELSEVDAHTLCLKLPRLRNHYKIYSMSGHEVVRMLFVFLCFSDCERCRKLPPFAVCQGC